MRVLRRIGRGVEGTSLDVLLDLRRHLEMGRQVNGPRVSYGPLHPVGGIGSYVGMRRPQGVPGVRAEVTELGAVGAARRGFEK